jgi:hypothetical protein
MPRDSAHALQLPLFVRDTAVFPEALARYESIRPILKGKRSLRRRRQQTGINDWRLWRDLQYFRGDGLLGLSIGTPCPMRGENLLLSPKVFQRHRQRARQAPSPPWPSGHQLGLPFEPTARAQRVEPALGPEYLLICFRTYREYPTEAQARWRIIEWLEVGFRPRRVARLLAIDPHVVDHWQRRFKTAGLLRLSTRPRERPSIRTRVSVHSTDRCGPWCRRNPAVYLATTSLSMLLARVRSAGRLPCSGRDIVGARRVTNCTRSLEKRRSKVQSRATRTFFSKRGNLLR